MEADVPAHHPQNVEQRRARRIDADTTDKERRAARNQSGDDEVRRRRKVARYFNTRGCDRNRPVE
jgi:hypothetical protein